MFEVLDPQQQYRLVAYLSSVRETMFSSPSLVNPNTSKSIYLTLKHKAEIDRKWRLLSRLENATKIL